MTRSTEEPEPTQIVPRAGRILVRLLLVLVIAVAMLVLIRFTILRP